MHTIPWTAKIVLALLTSVPLSVVVSWFIIEGLKLKETVWPKTVARSSVLMAILFYLIL